MRKVIPKRCQGTTVITLGVFPMPGIPKLVDAWTNQGMQNMSSSHRKAHSPDYSQTSFKDCKF